MGMALRGYYRRPATTSPSSSRTSTSGTATATSCPGYGWIFPLGDGRVNVGVGLLSTDRRWKGVNTGTLMEHFVAWAPKEWELSPGHRPRPADRAASCRWDCRSAPGWAPPPWSWATPPGTINPFNGEGIAYGYETGRLAAASLGEALSGDGFAALLRYEDRLEEAYGLYYRVARAFIRVIARPELMKLCVGHRACTPRR